ncbi:MAG: FTR1 family protein [Armatimonadetes bacterium]|nr:FTR1 family protein [Armatimonadota bacterium]
MIWQAIGMSGTPDPTAHGISRTSAVMGSAILVFREGLEAILVLAAVTAGLARYRQGYWPPVLAGIGAALAASIATWFIAIALIGSVNASELAIQAGTGLLAIVVLLVVMNWFFHKLYWTGWICHHCKRRDRIFEEPGATASRVYLGLALLGFTAIYREGFEIVLFLQDLRLKAGSGVVMNGVGFGLVLTSVVAALTFTAHRRMPYKKMLVWTGILLAGVLIVMVGESAQEMQLAGWLPTHPLPLPIPDWMGVWFATFPNIEGLASQLLAALLVVGSFLWVRSKVPRTKSGELVTAKCEVSP